jgi:proteasome lid subunit RPN8/RPN11
VRTVYLGEAVLEQIVAWAEHERPRECCGLLLGRGDEIVEAVAVENDSADPNRFELNPAGHISARRDARDRGLIVAGVFHSHPRTAARPSPRDLAEASYAEYLYGIVSLQAAEPDFRVFQLSGERFEEVGVVIDRSRRAPRAAASR